jgi:glycosyltransferase involved in cell wall biosynthesis
VSADRCLLVENAIDTDDYRRRTDVATAKRREGLAPDRLVIGAVGRLSAEKGFDVLIRAGERLVQAGHELDVVIAGDGGAEPQLRALIAKLGLQDRVRLVGHRGDPRGLYEAMDLFVLSSYREGLPNVVLEAMAMGVPVVATRVAGVPRLVRDGDNGVLVEPGSADGLAAAIAPLLADAGGRARLAAAGRRTVAADYSFARRMDRVRDLFDRLLDRN